MKVDLTKQQIKSLLYVIGETTDHSDAMIAAHPEGLQSINTTIRAVNKLRKAIGRPLSKEWTKEDLKYNEQF